MTCKISGAWVVTRTCPWDGTESTLGLFPEAKAALLKLEDFMHSPEDNEEYKIEYHVFESLEQILESHQRCKANRAEWDKKDEVYKKYLKEQERLDDLIDADEYESIKSDT